MVAPGVEGGHDGALVGGFAELDASLDHSGERPDAALAQGLPERRSIAREALACCTIIATAPAICSRGLASALASSIRSTNSCNPLPTSSQAGSV